MISYEEFAAAARRLHHANLGWKWVLRNEAPSLGEGYLQCNSIRPQSKQSDQQQLCSTDTFTVDHFLPPTITTSTPLIAWKFYICYSNSYREPVLYFQAHDQSGTAIPVAEIFSQLDFGTTTTTTKYSSSDSVPAVTQEEHPVLHCPAYMLHPCQTGEVMQLLLASEKEKESDDDDDAIEERKTDTTSSTESREQYCLRYLLAWLCVAGGPFKLRLSPEEWHTALKN